MRFKLAFLMAAMSAAGTAHADPIVLDQWYTFGFGGVGTSLVSGDGYVLGVNPPSIAAPDADWTFTLNGSGTLTVVDGFLSGDQFEISNFGSIIGATSVPTDGADCGDDITLCLATPGMSIGTFALGAGDYSIGGAVLASPFGGGAGFFIVTSDAGPSVPEPATWGMMLLGMGAVGGAMRARKRVAVRFA